MKKIVLSVIVLFGFTLIFTPVNRAADFVFPVSTKILPATGVSVVATPVDSASDAFGTPGATEFAFGTLSFDAVNGIWLPDHYYAVDVGVIGGVGSTNVNVKYAIGASPTGQTEGLEFRATATFVRILGGPAPSDQTEELLTGHGPTKVFNQLTGSVGEFIPSADLNGGFFRTYIGIYPGGNAAVDAAGGAPFTNNDLPGDYFGTITITATVA